MPISHQPSDVHAMEPAGVLDAAIRSGIRKIDRVVVINDDCVESGGAAAIAVLSAKILRSKGLAVTFATGDDASKRDLSDLGVEVVRLDGRHLLDGARSAAALRGLYDPGPRRELAKWMRLNDTPHTVYHLHNWHKFLSPSVFSALRPVTDRLAISLHDFFLVCPNGGFFEFPAGRVCDRVPMSCACLTTSCDKRSVAHKVWRTARHLVRHRLFPLGNSHAKLVVVHEGMQAVLANSGVPATAMMTIRNPVTPWLDRRVEAERNRDFLFVGRVERDKGIHVLAQAARHAGVRLRVIGDGPLRSDLAERFPEIRFLGRMNRAQISVEAGLARAVIVPSLVRETFGLVVLEAAASGLPVIVSDSAFIAREVTQNEFGQVVPAGNIAELSSALADMSTDDAGVAAMSKAAFREARHLLATPEMWAGQLVGLYATMIGQADCGPAAASGSSAFPVRQATLEAGS